MWGIFGRIFKVAAHPITAMVVRSLPEGIAFIESWITAYADKKLTPTEKKDVADKLNALARSVLGI